MKKYCVVYKYTVWCDAGVWAENERVASEKVKEVLPDVKIDRIWEIKNNG